jgi:hypothetical protein
MTDDVSVGTGHFVGVDAAELGKTNSPVLIACIPMTDDVEYDGCDHR